MAAGPSQGMARRSDGLGSAKGRGWKGERIGTYDPEVLAYGIRLHLCKKKKKKKKKKKERKPLPQIQ